MDLAAYREEIKLRLTGKVIRLELDDATIDMAINASLREIQRYIDTTKLITIPFRSCIDMTEYKVSSVSRVFRTDGYDVTGSGTGSQIDPMALGIWQIYAGIGNVRNINRWALDYASWNTALQLRNTISTDLVHRFDKSSNLLYISCGFDNPQLITIEYIPRYDDVSMITSDYWIDVLLTMSCALVKQILGRIRTRYTLNNTNWTMDGDKLLAEGETELLNIRESLQKYAQLNYPID